ncbi:SDR family oxidoreductase [Amycolatopsis minnesotensis]|uniref:NAD(P)H-binding protein n=1 Tax=Amycolatopsis minnesotensis TaxID=337894 RepID=A0ABN2Q1Y3_9PSEU
MTHTILVTGGTGTLGKRVVPLLRATGHRVRVLSRHHREPADGVEYVTGDLVADEGIPAAVAGAEIIVHLAGGPKGDDIAARNLVRAAADAGSVRHLVYISVVGADRVPLGWFRTALAAEQAVTGSGLPYTLLRAAQFHEIVFGMLGKMAKLPVIPNPGGLRFQPVDARDVAARLVELALGAPAGRVPDLTGPTVYTMDKLIRGFLEEQGKRRPLLPIRIPGKAGRAYRAGENLTLDGTQVGERSWESFLADKESIATR